MNNAITHRGLHFVDMYLFLRKHYNEHLKDLKTSDIKNANERGPLTFRPVQGFVDAMNQPTKESLIGCLSKGFNSKVSLKGKQRGRV